MPIDPAKYRLEAEQAEVIRELEESAWNWLDSDLSLVTIDTIVYEHYRDLGNALIWLEGVHHEWLRVNMEFAEKASSTVMFRFIVTPYPAVLDNPFQRKALREFIILNVHLHLWHGIVCCVKFLDPRVYSPNIVVEELNFFAFPIARSFYDLPGFNRADSVRTMIVTGAAYDIQQRRVQDWIVNSGAAPIWLFYDEDHFATDRLAGWHWNQLRKFFGELSRGDDLCPECRQRRASELDHIGPISQGYPQTLPNLQLLCGQCNRLKGKLEGGDPLVLRYHLPDHLLNRELQTVLKEIPPWVGTIRRPARRLSALFEAAGFK